jgi:hypothetical protein
MKQLLKHALDLTACRREVVALKRLIDKSPSLDENAHILPFFRKRRHLSALCGLYHPHMARFDLLAWEYDLFGDFSCDLVVGDSARKAFNFIEFEDAGPKSLFVRRGKKATREWSPRFDHGYSQIVDWFYKLHDRAKSDEFEARFGARAIDFTGTLVVCHALIFGYNPPWQERDPRQGGRVVAKKYVLTLTAEERTELEQLVKKGKAAGWKLQRAQALLQCDQGPDGPGWADALIAAAYGRSTRTLESWRQQALESGPLSLRERQPRRAPAVTPVLDGEQQARLTALACSQPPQGYARWTLRLLAVRLVELEVVEGVSHETVRRALKKA